LRGGRKGGKEKREEGTGESRREGLFSFSFKPPNRQNEFSYSLTFDLAHIICLAEHDISGGMEYFCRVILTLLCLSHCYEEDFSVLLMSLQLDPQKNTVEEDLGHAYNREDPIA
jgi:hypothetical protein